MKYEFIQYCKENKKTVFLVSVAILVIMAGQLLSYFLGGKQYILDGTGQVVAISRGSLDKAISLPIKVEVTKGDKSAKEEVVLSFPGKEVGNKGTKPGATNENDIEALLRSVADEISQSEKKMVPLPKTTEEGLKLKWNRSGGIGKSLLLVLLVPIVLFFLFRERQDRLHKMQQTKVQSIQRGLPTLNNQLLLLLNSGLIFNDAFLHIVDSYKRRSGKVDYLGQVILEIMTKSEKTNRSLVLSLDEEVKLLGIKEFSRVTGIILDNQYKGVNLIDKLTNESELLWTQRKKVAEEKGKLAETKLAFPLAILLVVLIIVTAAPAILQI